MVVLGAAELDTAELDTAELDTAELDAAELDADVVTPPLSNDAFLDSGFCL